jgi:hypothetical protein
MEAGVGIEPTLRAALCNRTDSKPCTSFRPQETHPADDRSSRGSKNPSADVTIERLIEVKKFADSFGGADQVQQALDTLQQLR